MKVLIISFLVTFILLKIFVHTYHGPNSSVQKKQIYEDDITGKFYRFKPRIYDCSSKLYKSIFKK